MKTAIITGISGQCSRYLAPLLLNKDYKVYGTMRRQSHPDMSFIEEAGLQEVEIIDMDLSDNSSIQKVIDKIKPNEFYNLAAMSHVGLSFNQPEYTADVTGIGPLRILENIRLFSPQTRFYQASTSELFGKVKESPQTENTPFNPQSPYAAAKLFAHNIVKIYRDGYGLFAAAGICMNMESPHRSKDFVTRKITDWIGQYLVQKNNGPLELGNLEAKRDWGFTGKHVEAMWLMLQQLSPKDYVISTGETHSIQEFCNIAFKLAGIPIYWEGSGADKKAYNYDNNDLLIKINPKYYRPAEVELLLGDSSLATKELGWKYDMEFEQLVSMMVYADIERYYHVNTKNQTNHAKKISSITE